MKKTSYKRQSLRRTQQRNGGMNGKRLYLSKSSDETLSEIPIFASSVAASDLTLPYTVCQALHQWGA